MTELAQQLIEKERETRSGYLDLGRCGLTEMPNLSDMDWLETLILSNDWVDLEKGEWINSQNKGDANRLTTPNVDNFPKNIKNLVLGGGSRNNWEIKDTRFLSNLTALKTLDLRYNEISDLSFLSSLSGLTTLDLGFNQISDVSFLSSLSGLTTLALGENQISDISFLPSLSGLTTLDLSDNEISDFSFLSSLSGLTTLYLEGNYISDFAFLFSLSSLTTLDLSDNEIDDVSFLSSLSSLTKLYLNDNEISDVSFLSSLSGLTMLYLRSNQISDVSFLPKLPYLSQIDLSNNRIDDLSPLQYFLQEKGMQAIWGQSFFTREGEINVNDNPLTHPPVEIVQQGNEAILRYFEEKERLEKIGQPVYVKVREAKVLIVGQGKSGKTSLRVKLENPEAAMPASGDTTRGIEITQLDERMPHSGDPLRLNLWDFGGQNVQHFAHQLFLTGNALYVLVTNERIQDQVHLPYWLNIIDMLGKKSPILLVQNMDGGHCEPLKNEASIQATFSNVQKPVFQTDISKAHTEVAFSQLRKKIIEIAAVLPHIEKDYLSSFHHLREKIEAEAAQQKHYLKWGDYLQLMPELSEDLMRDNANSLTFLGVCQYFPDDLTLRNYIFLRPKWLIDALFDLILHPSLDTARGHFSENDTLQIWKGKDYTGMHNLLLRIMEEFELCYRVQGEGRDYIVPQRLPGENQTYGWPYEGDTPVQFQYKFLPKGILTRLICRLHPRIEKQADLGQRVWCDAVIFTLSDGKGCVFAREVYAQNTIELRATGEKRAEILNQVIQTLDDIHTDPKTRFENLVVEKMVPCPCEECSKAEIPGFHEFGALKKRIEKGKTTSECKKSGDDVPIDEIFGKSGVKKPEFRRDWDFNGNPPTAKDSLALKNVRVNVLKKQTILMLTANPAQTTLLKIKEEHSAIAKELEDNQERFLLKCEHSVNKSEFMRFPEELRPDILHFSGHGYGGDEIGTGIVVQNDDKNKPDLITPYGLNSLFEYYKRNNIAFKTVILNACYTDEQAEIIARYVPYVIGVTVSVIDEHSIAFSKGFYAELSNSTQLDFIKAFDSGRMRAVLEGAKEEHFVLFKHGEKFHFETN